MSTTLQPIIRKSFRPSRTPKRARLATGKTVDVPELMTLDAFEAWPTREDERWELLWGVPTMAPRPLPYHNTLAIEIASYLRRRLDLKRFYVTTDSDLQLAKATSQCAPDVLVFRHQKGFDPMSRPQRVVPDLLVECLSPSNEDTDFGDKLEAYAIARVPEYWIADPATGGLWIHCSPRSGRYERRLADSRGYVCSPFLSRAVRIRHVGVHDFKVVDKRLS